MKRDFIPSKLNAFIGFKLAHVNYKSKAGDFQVLRLKIWLLRQCKDDSFSRFIRFNRRLGRNVTKDY